MQLKSVRGKSISLSGVTVDCHLMITCGADQRSLPTLAEHDYCQYSTASVAAVQTYSQPTVASPCLIELGGGLLPFQALAYRLRPGCQDRDSASCRSRELPLRGTRSRSVTLWGSGPTSQASAVVKSATSDRGRLCSHCRVFDSLRRSLTVLSESRLPRARRASPAAAVPPKTNLRPSTPASAPRPCPLALGSGPEARQRTIHGHARSTR